MQTSTRAGAVKVARCTASVSRLDVHGRRWFRGRCAGEVRPAQVVAAELRDYGAKWRAIVVQYVARGDDMWEVSNAASRQVDHRLDEDLTSLGMELAEKLCPECAEVKARRWLSLRALVFVAVLAVATGKDERAQEEFNLGAAA